MTMSSERRSDNGGAGDESIPAESREMVDSLKEIVNCSKLEIYCALKDCNMDPNEAVNRLLSQDPFHQVKSKRDKKKENKDLPETKFRVGGSNSLRGSKSDRGRGGSAPFGSYDSSAFQGKLSYKKDKGTNSVSVPQVAVDNPSWRPSEFRRSVTMDNETSKRSVVEGILASQTNSGYQSVWVGVSGHKSLADIIKTEGPQSSSTDCFDHAPKSTVFSQESSSENQLFKVTDQYEKQGAAPDEWPLFEPPEIANLSVLDSHAESQRHRVQSDLTHDKTTQHLRSGNDELKEEEEESCKNCNDYHGGSATVSDRTQGIKSENALLHGNGMYTKLGPYPSYNYAFQNEEVKDGVATSVLSETANLQHLSIQEEDRKPSYEEDGPSVVIPDHLQVQSADCSHLSFGSFRSGLATGISRSRSSRNNMEETPIVDDASVIRKADMRKTEFYGKEAFLTVADEILAYRGSGVAGTFDSASASQSNFIKQEYPEVVGSQYTCTPDSTNYPFQGARQQNTAFSYPQTSSWMQNLASFSNAMVYEDPSSSTLLAANVPVRDSELSYSPFPAAQSVAAKYGNTVSSMNGSSISLEEALKTGLQSLHPTQHHLSGKRVTSEHFDPHHLAAHQNFQPTHPLGPFANMHGYSNLPQNETYMPSAFQQAFAGNGTYHQSLAAVLPQYKRSVPVNSLPQSAAVPPGYKNFRDSNTIAGNYAMNPSVVPAGSTIGYDDLLSTRYKDNSYSISLQQNDNSAMWLGGHGSRTMPAVPASTYYSLRGPDQDRGGLGQGLQSSLNYGDRSFNNSQTGMPLEQHLENPRSGSLGGNHVQSKQPQQIWQNSY